MTDSTYTCKYCGEIFTGHHNKNCCYRPGCLDKHNNEISEIGKKRSKENRRKRKLKTKTKNSGNSCIRCNDPKGVNRWYCTRCLKYLTKLYGDTTTYKVELKLF